MGLINKAKNLISGTFRGLYKNESKEGSKSNSNFESTSGSRNKSRGYRTSVASFNSYSGGFYNTLPKKARRDLSLDDRILSNMSVDDLIDALSDSHPDVSFAIWNFLRIGNCGYTINVYKVNSKERYYRAEKEISKFIRSLKSPNLDRFEKSRALNKVINQLMLSVITRGACAMEVVLDENRESVSYFAPVDPSTIEFRVEDGRLIPYQDYGRVCLDIPTFFYEGLDERIDDPYGRSPILSAIAIILFQLQVLNDVKAVVHSQGYPKMDIEILEEILIQRMPINIRNNEEEKQLWLQERLSEILTMYSDLEPDASYVHFDSVKIGMVGGGSSGKGALIDPQKLMTVIDNLIMSGLKTLSTILGRRSTGNTESFAKLEIKLYIQGVKAIQEVISGVIERALTLVLNMQGIQGDVEFYFNPVEVRTELEQEQFKQIKYLNVAYARDQGWIDQEEAARYAVGHAPVGDPDWEHLQPVKNKDGETPKGTTDVNDSAGGSEDMSSSS